MNDRKDIVYKTNKTNGNKVVLFFLLLALLMSLTACAPEEETEPSPTVESYEATLFFGNQEYIDTGDETLELLIPEQRDIELGDYEKIGLAMLEALKTVTAEGGSTAIGADIVFNDVYSSPDNTNTIIVDLGSDGLSGSSLEETLFIDQIVATIINNGPYFADPGKTAEKVQFLVNGEKAETLMGHIDAGEPFTEIFK